MPQADYRERHARLGLCDRCPRPRLPGYVRCRKHRDENRRRTRELHNARHAQGLCAICGKKPLASKWYCEKHLVALRGYVRKSLAG